MEFVFETIYNQKAMTIVIEVVEQVERRGVWI